MKKRICMGLGIVMMLGCLIACSNPVEVTVTINKSSDKTLSEKVSEYITYEFQTFDGDTVIIDEASIVTQEACDYPEDSELISKEAAGNVIAPGRDFIYLEDDNYYYAADYINRLITVADKSKVTITKAAGE